MGATTTSPWSLVYQPSFNTSIKSETLTALRALTSWVLQRERATQTGSVPPPAPEALREQLAALLPAVLFQGIQRHRLQSFLQSDPAVFELLPELQADFQNAIRSEAMAALALASLTREMAELFAKAGIPLLVIKGIPLALQTTGSMTARGRGDCDLFVAPSQVGASIALLQSVGFALTYGASCVGDDSMRGRYSRFISIEISLHRDVGGRRQWIDLHWHATHAIGLLPEFKELWDRRESVYVNNQLIFTLSLFDALHHCCCHSTLDRWMLLRNLVDIERLFLKLPFAQMMRLQKQRHVRKSLAVLSDCGFLSDSTSEFSRSLLLLRYWFVVRLARRTQLSINRTDENIFLFGLRCLNMSWDPLNWIAKIFLMLAPPDVLIDRTSGKTLSLSRVVKMRLEKLSYQISIRNAASQRFRVVGVKAESHDRPA